MARPTIDAGRPIDWGETSSDYAAFRPGPPAELYDRLSALGIGLRDQRVLDLATGTGVVARALARRGAVVAGIDIAPEQIDHARRHSQNEGLAIDFRVAAAEELPFRDHSFDVATANQCFLYFDAGRTLAGLRRVLVPGGRLVTSHFNWLPRLDAIARRSEELVLKHNPDWQGADFDGVVKAVPDWVPRDIVLEGFFWFDADVPFSRETWRGRIRASRGIGATLNAAAVAAFDEEHSEMLERTAPPRFTIRHRVDARILRFP